MPSCSSATRCSTTRTSSSTPTIWPPSGARTGLPFAFAVWVARKGTPYEVTDALEEALTFGVERIYEAVQQSDYRDRPYAYDYLTRNIDFLFDNEKRKALQKFWTSGVKVTPLVEPG